MPYDWLTDEEVTPEELDYRDSIRNSVMSGEVPLDPAWGEMQQSQPAEPQLDLSQDTSTEPIPPPKLPQEPADDPAWKAFEDTMDKSYAGLNDTELEQAFRVQAQKDKRGLNKASTLIADRELETDIVGSGKPTPFTAGQNLTDAKGGFFGTKTDPLEAWDMISQGLQDITAVPGVTDFIQDKVNPAVADFVGDKLKDPTGLAGTVKIIANRVGLSKQYEAANDTLPARLWGKVAEFGGQSVADLIPSTGIDLGFSLLAPALGDLRGGLSAVKGIQEAEAAAIISKAALAETIGEAGPQLAKSLTTVGLRQTAKKFVDEGVLLGLNKKSLNATREAIQKALPTLTHTEVDSMIVAQRLKGLEVAQQVQDVLKLQAEDMVTVYHGATSADINNIARKGFNKGGFVTTDPSIADSFAKINSRFSNTPGTGEVISFQVPRVLLQESTDNPLFFTLKDNVNTGIRFNEDDRNVVQTIRDFLKNPDFNLSSERGSFTLPGKVPESRGPGAGVPGQWEDVWGWVDPDGNFTGLNGHNHNVVGDIDQMKSEGWIRTNGSSARGNKSVNIDFKPVNGNDAGVRNFINKNIDLRDPNVKILIVNNDIEGAAGKWFGTGIEWARQGRPVPGEKKPNALVAALVGGERGSVRIPDVGVTRGLPKGIKTPADLASLMARVTAQAVEGASARFWYDRSAAAIMQMAQGDMKAADKIARITALTSANTSVSGQGTLILRAWSQVADGLPVSGVHTRKTEAVLNDFLNMDDDQTVKFVTGLIQNKSASTAKLGNFYVDLLDDINPNLAGRIRAESGATTTIDRWMNRAFGFGDKRTPEQYKFMSDAVVKIANDLGWTPKQVQAAIWVVQKKDADEAVRLKKLAEGIKASKTPVGITHFDYKDSLRRHIGQISWESAPGKDTLRSAKLADYDSWPDELKAEFHLATSRIFQGPNGEDRLAAALGVPVETAFDAPGVFEGIVSKGRQVIAYIGNAKGGPKAGLDASQYERVSDYARAIGYALNQNAAAWTRPVPEAPTWMHNALTLNLGGSIDPEDAKRFSELLGDGYAIVPTEDGTHIFRIKEDADFAVKITASAKDPAAVERGVINKQARERIQAAINEVYADDKSVKIKSFSTDGDYIESVDGSGQDYLRGRSRLERPDVRALLDEFSSSRDALDEEFAQRRAADALTDPTVEPGGNWARRADPNAPDAAADALAFGNGELDSATRAVTNANPPGRPLNDATSELEKTQAEVSRMRDDDVRGSYENARQRASTAQNELDDHLAQIESAVQARLSGMAENLRTPEVEQRIRDNLDNITQDKRRGMYEALRLTQKYGEELAGRTQGQEGITTKIASAIKKAIGDETGSVYIWGVGPVKPSHPLGAPIVASKLAPAIEEARVAAEYIIPKAFNLGTDRPGLARRLAGKLAPGFQMPRVVLVANEARRYIEAQAPSYVNPLARAAKGVTEAWAKAPPVWKGEWDDASAAFIIPKDLPKTANTAADFLERPWNYDNVSAELVQAQQGWDKSFDGLLVRLNDEHGLQIEPYYGYEPNLQKVPTVPRRGSYVPHMDSDEYLRRMEKEGLTGARSTSKTTSKEMLEKERHIPTLSERVKLDPDFEPELDLNTLAVKYGASATRAAAKDTQEAIIGGKTVIELMEELHPQMMAMRKAQMARVTNTRQQIVSLRNALKLAGYGEKKLDGQLTMLARRESIAAGKVEKAADDFEHIADLRAEANTLKREATAYTALVNKIVGAGKAVNERLDTVAKLRDKLTTFQQTAIDKLDDYDQKITDAAAGADDAKVVNLRTQRNVAVLEGRIKALQAFDESFGALEEGAITRQAVLQEKLAELKKASISVTMGDLTKLNERIKAAETASIKDAMEAMGAQRELRGLSKNAENQLKVAMKRVNDLTNGLDKKMTELEHQTRLNSKLKDAYSVTKDGIPKNYKLDPVTKKYVHPRVQEAQAAISNIGDDSNILNLLEEGRAIQLSTGDLSPIMYGRSQMGAFGYLGTLANQLSPIQKNAMGNAHIAVPKLIAKGLAQGDTVWDGVNPEYLRVFQGVRGRAVTMPTDDIRATEKLRGAERLLTGARGSKIPVVGNVGVGLRKMNDAMTRMATFAEYSAWETSVRAELRAHPNKTLVEVGEGVYKGMSNISARTDFTRLGYSPAQSRVLNAGFTSLSYMASTPQFTVAYPKSLAKLGANLFTKGLNPKEAWRALGVADRETIVHGSELLGTLSVLAGTSAALFGDEGTPVDERVLDAVNPLGSKGWSLQLPGGGSIPLAIPLRAGIRTTAATLQGAGVPVNAIPGANVRGDAMAPVNYVGNRLISAPSFIYHLAKNEDWQGREIVNPDQDIKGKLTDAVMYGLESMSIVTAPTIHAVRTGEVGNAGAPASVGRVIQETLESQGGLNVYDPSRTTQYRALQQSVMDELIKDGTIPPDKAQLFKDMDYNELPSSLRKLVDMNLEEKHADAKDWYERGRRLDNNPFQQVADKADAARAEYAKEFDILQTKLFNGEDPAVVWKAYEIKKAELRGRMSGIYNDNKDYNDAIAGLEIGDMRRIEDGWYAITEAMYAKNAGALSDKDYQDLANQKADYIMKLVREVPDKAELFVYSLKVQEANALDEAHPMEVLRKQARTELAPYYAIPEDDQEGRQAFLQNNPSADVARWLTSATSSPAVNSIAALESAYSIIPKRGVHLSGSDQIVTDDNLPTFKQYAKEIERMYSLPSTQRYPNDPSRTFNPRTELRKQSPLYDAIWFWLGMVTPDDKNTVPVYHPLEVQQYIRMWGPRGDKANIRSY